MGLASAKAYRKACLQACRAAADGTKPPKDQGTKGPKTKQEAFVARRGILEACKRAERAQEAESQWGWRLRKRTGKRACKRAGQRLTGPSHQRTKGQKDQRRSRKLLGPGGEYLKRAGVPSVPKKLSHNGLGVCESVPESVLASVPCRGPRD